MARNKNRFTRQMGERRYKRLFLPATEGAVTEPEYFQMLRQWASDAQLQIIRGTTASAPQQILKRLQAEIKATSVRKGMEAWLVVDKDGWTDTQLQALHEWVGEDRKTRGLSVSNPNFEYWLLLHFEEGSGVNGSRECKERLLRHLPNYRKHIDSQAFTHDCITQAIQRATAKDRDPDAPWPQENGSRVYLLVERILHKTANP